MPKFAVILAAAGNSTRFGNARRKKPFIELKGRPVWVRAIEPFLAHPDVVQSLVVVSPSEIDWFKEQFRANLAFMNLEVVPGGKERTDSVRNGLERVLPDVDFVAVHDAARPLITRQWIDAVFEAASASGAAIPAVPISSTIKRVQGKTILETVPRDQLWSAQTPQVIARQTLLEAYAQRSGPIATDEAQLVEQLGKTVTIVETSPVNLKITTQTDFRMAEALLSILPKEKNDAWQFL